MREESVFCTGVYILLGMIVLIKTIIRCSQKCRSYFQIREIDVAGIFIARVVHIIIFIIHIHDIIL